VKEYLGYYINKGLRNEIIFAVVLLAASLTLNFFAGIYATESASNPVTDIILSNTRVYDLDGVFIFGSWFLFLFITLLCIWRPWKAPFTIKTVALFVVIRAIFFSVTHIGPFPTQVELSPNGFMSYFVFGGDLFFSGHTGLPFLLALINWKEKWLRYLFISLSIILAIVVLLTHLHYTIDVLSAWFISYGIYKIAERFFAKDLEYFNNKTLQP
jgi:PAP2 superfamily C-terminal